MKHFQTNSTAGISTMVGAAIVVVIVVLALALFLGTGLFTTPSSSSTQVPQATSTSQSQSSSTGPSTSSTTVAPAGASSIYVKIASGASLSSRIPAGDPGINPSSIIVVIGVNNTVVWTNYDSATHTVTANDGSFDSKDLKAGQSFSYTFTAPGTFGYHCIYHGWMVGQVMVKPGK